MALLSFFRPTTVFLLGALLFSGCCANNTCDCQDARADAINLRFSSAFTAADLDTIVVQRSPLPFSATNKVESVTIIRTAAQLRDTLRINNNAPFPQVSTTKLDGYRYVIQYLTQQPKSKPAATTLLIINEVALSGRLDGDGCCTCYINTEKVVNATKPKGATTAADSTFTIDLNQKPVIELTK
ncbi:hypothetical protein [Hymenobacter glacialis]|uniref:Lipoprotein n=1 Tax=Hymenobacter glacialis TaxID=1908236 RepID=A0A1G1T1C5_9BACT|nr:hypothetical protein [Hymenobacter glacialis]OGX84670.1 hypothetical protein BEN48_02725 [Hymenobacter glacialis]